MIEVGDVAVVILAAGLSDRFGPDDKLMALYRGSPLVAHAGRLTLQLSFRARLAVVRENSDPAAMLGAFGLSLHLNPAPAAGIGSSLAIAAHAAADIRASALLVLLGDMPNVTPAHLMRLLTSFGPGAEIVVSNDGRQRSPPALFGQRHFAELKQLSGNEGAIKLAKLALSVTADPSVLSDVDTPTDLRAGDGLAGRSALHSDSILAPARL